MWISGRIYSYICETNLYNEKQVGYLLDIPAVIAHIVWRILVIFSRDRNTETFGHLHDVTKLYLHSHKSYSHGANFSIELHVLFIPMKPSKCIWKRTYVF